MIKGITPNEEIIIKEILKLYPYSFYYYGSRVKGGFFKSFWSWYINKIK